jgi:uncharacterized protein (TIGR00255 family)
MTDPSSALCSMTAFARVEGSEAGLSWAWEMRGVNGRGLDVRCRLPSGFEALEPKARAAVQGTLARGNIQINLTVSEAAGGERLAIDRALFDQVLALARELEGAGAAPPRLDALLSVRGVIAPVERDDTAARDSVFDALEVSLGRLIERFIEARQAEGAHLFQVLSGLIAEIDTLVARARECEAARPEALRQRLRDLLDTLLAEQPPVPEDRLAQELAIQIAKLDVREELDRLQAHIAQAHALLAEGRAVGRRLDFLAQEFNREANTLCSKSADAALTQIGMALKVAIDQVREQVQNVE